MLKCYVEIFTPKQRKKKFPVLLLLFSKCSSAEQNLALNIQYVRNECAFHPTQRRKREVSSNEPRTGTLPLCGL